jgi:hypothetical protein
MSFNIFKPIFAMLPKHLLSHVVTFGAISLLVIALTSFALVIYKLKSTPKRG